MTKIQIKELAERLHITTRAIRFYEEKGLIHPEKHEHNGYRLFSEQDAARLQTIISMREVGMSLDEIGVMLSEMEKGDSEDVLHHLELQRAILFSQLVEIQQSIETTDQIIRRFKDQQLLAWNDIFEWTRKLAEFKALRSAWRDHWNYDHRAGSHDERVGEELNQLEWGSHPSYRYALERVFRTVDPNRGEQGVDLGTGTGNLAALFIRQGIEMMGMDQSIAMLRTAERKLSGYEARLGNFLAIPYKDNRFDFAVSSYALHHLTDEQKQLALYEIQRILKPHGRICIVDFMFENEQVRQDYINHLESEQRTDILTEIERSYYADRSRLLEWFETHGYVTRTEEIHTRLHLIYAVPVKGHV
ncbi:MerR family transcriptional regulator [Neobacillus mesonae]|nr:MerR family transcriptional regulator [Neobacillus mesonae]